MVFEPTPEHPSQWATITSIAAKIGCYPETLRAWVRRVECDAGTRPGLTTEERERLKQVVRKNRELLSAIRRRWEASRRRYGTKKAWK